LSGLAVMILMFPISGVIATKLRALQARQMKIKDERVKSMNEILNGMKVLKLYAWEPSFEDSVLETRTRELDVLRGAALWNASTEFTWSLAPFFVAFASFATYVYMGNVLTPETTFVSLALFNILRMPMAMRKFWFAIDFLMSLTIHFFR